MSTKRFLFQVAAAASCDGVTEFELPAPPAPNTNGQLVYAVDATTGNLGRLVQSDPNWGSMVGRGPYSARVSFAASNVAGARLVIGLIQPQPTLTYFAGTALTTLGVLAEPFAATQAVQTVEFYVPTGWPLVLLVDNGVGVGVPVVGPYSVAIEVSTLPKLPDVFRAIVRAGYFNRWVAA